MDVLLSTFNAGEYLLPLLESVQSQKGVEVHLHVRDDGSTDGTRQAVSQLAKGGDAEVELGGHLGPWKSYFCLLTSAKAEAGFVAFCDQDDLWLPDKLGKAVSVLKGSTLRPAMYCGRLTLTDAKLNPVGLSPLPRRPLLLSNALVENVALGPTIVINRLGKLLLTQKVPDYAVMHDSWAYLVFSALGDIQYDEEPRVLYRLHDQNHVGIQLNRLVRLYRLGRYRPTSYMSAQLAQAREFARLFSSELRNSDRRIPHAVL